MCKQQTGREREEGEKEKREGGRDEGWLGQEGEGGKL